MASSTTDETGSASTGGSTGDSASATEGDPTTADGGSESGGEPSGPSMWDCDLPRSCPQLFYHLDPWDDPDAVECAARLIVSGEPGELTALISDVVVEYETWLFIEPEGTVLTQDRERECGFDDIDCVLDELPWGPPSGVMRCSMGGTEDLPADCDADADGCEWWPWRGNLVDCVEIEPPTCEELEGIVAASG